MSKKLYRRVIVLEILTADQGTVETQQLDELHYEITEGGASGAIIADSFEQVDADFMRHLLIAQGNEPEFLLGEDDDLLLGSKALDEVLGIESDDQEDRGTGTRIVKGHLMPKSDDR